MRILYELSYDDFTTALVKV